MESMETALEQQKLKLEQLRLLHENAGYMENGKVCEKL